MKEYLKPLYRLWMRFAHVLGWINGRIILTLLYVVILGPYAMVRSFGRLFRSRVNPQTFWIPHNHADPTLENLRRIF